MKIQLKNLVKLQKLDKEIAGCLGDGFNQPFEDSFNSMEKLDQLRITRSNITKKIDQRFIRYYERLKGNKGEATAVVPVAKSVCQGCFIAVSTATSAKLFRKDSIATCEHCGRFIYSAE